jgi:bifunctional DNase/RNase
LAEIEVEIESVRQGTMSNKCTLMLKDKSEERYLPIYIGDSQASRIKELLMGIPVSGRQEPDPWHNIPGDLELVSVVINKFEDNEFFASLRFKRGNKTKEFRIQLTEAIIASIIKEVPIFVEESVLVKAGVTV